MAKSSLLLTLAQISTIQIEQSNVQRLTPLPPCRLKWRAKQLWVKAVTATQASPIPAVRNEKWLTECLLHSSVRIVCLDINLGEAALRQWADIANAAGKQTFIRLPKNVRVEINQYAPQFLLEKLFYQLVASLLLVILLPLLLPLIALIRLFSPSIFSQQWAIGHQGRLFRLWQFRTQQRTRTDDLPERNLLQTFLYKTQLYRLPELVNSMRGETRLIGKSPLKLSGLRQLKLFAQEATSNPSQIEQISGTPDITHP